MTSAEITLRDYFAVHAPSEIPEWFVHIPPKVDIPPMPSFEELDPTHRNLVRDWQEDPIFDLPEELTWYGDKVKAHRAAREDARNANHKARFFQWRWHYATAMAAERGINPVAYSA